MKYKLKTWATIVAALLAVACTTENYDSGDGDYSYMRAEFVEAHTVEAKKVDYAVNDANRRITLTEPIAARWATTADSLYRALLYYNDAPSGAEPLAITQVYVLKPRNEAEVAERPTDPVAFESLWQSENGRWLNLGLQLKTGKADDEDAVQSIGMTRATDDDGLLHLRLLHDQGSVPQYYTTRVYVSVPLGGEVQLPLRLTVNTYEGPQTIVVSPSDHSE